MMYEFSAQAMLCQPHQACFARPISRCEDVEGTIFTKPKTYLECENYCQSNYRQKYIALRRQWSYKARWGMVNTTIHDVNNLNGVENVKLKRHQSPVEAFDRHGAGHRAIIPDYCIRRRSFRNIGYCNTEAVNTMKDARNISNSFNGTDPYIPKNICTDEISYKIQSIPPCKFQKQYPKMLKCNCNFSNIDSGEFLIQENIVGKPIKCDCLRSRNTPASNISSRISKILSRAAVEKTIWLRKTPHVTPEEFGSLEFGRNCHEQSKTEKIRLNIANDEEVAPKESFVESAKESKENISSREAVEPKSITGSVKIPTSSNVSNFLDFVQSGGSVDCPEKENNLENISEGNLRSAKLQSFVNGSEKLKQLSGAKEAPAINQDIYKSNSATITVNKILLQLLLNLSQPGKANKSSPNTQTDGFSKFSIGSDNMRANKAQCGCIDNRLSSTERTKVASTSILEKKLSQVKLDQVPNKRTVHEPPKKNLVNDQYKKSSHLAEASRKMKLILSRILNALGVCRCETTGKVKILSTIHGILSELLECVNSHQHENLSLENQPLHKRNHGPRKKLTDIELASIQNILSEIINSISMHEPKSTSFSIEELISLRSQLEEIFSQERSQLDSQDMCSCSSRVCNTEELISMQTKQEEIISKDRSQNSPKLCSCSTQLSNALTAQELSQNSAQVLCACSTAVCNTEEFIAMQSTEEKFLSHNLSQNNPQVLCSCSTEIDIAEKHTQDLPHSSSQLRCSCCPAESNIENHKQYSDQSSNRHHPSAHRSTSLRCIDIKDKSGTISIPKTMISIPKHNKKFDPNSTFKSEASKSQQMYLLATKSIRIANSPYFQSPEKQIREELSGDSIEEISEGQIQRHLALNQNIYGNILRDMRDVPIISTGKYLAHPSKSEIANQQIITRNLNIVNKAQLKPTGEVKRLQQSKDDRVCSSKRSSKSSCNPDQKTHLNSFTNILSRKNGYRLIDNELPVENVLSIHQIFPLVLSEPDCTQDSDFQKKNVSNHLATKKYVKLSKNIKNSSKKKFYRPEQSSTTSLFKPPIVPEKHLIQQSKRFSENKLSPAGKTKIRSGKDCKKRSMQVRHSLGTQCENIALYSTKSCKIVSHFASSKSPKEQLRRRTKSTKANSGEAAPIQLVDSVDSLESLTKKHTIRTESAGKNSKICPQYREKFSTVKVRYVMNPIARISDSYLISAKKPKGPRYHGAYDEPIAAKIKRKIRSIKDSLTVELFK